MITSRCNGLFSKTLEINLYQNLLGLVKRNYLDVIYWWILGVNHSRLSVGFGRTANRQQRQPDSLKKIKMHIESGSNSVNQAVFREPGVFKELSGSSVRCFN